jgi:hypothetical protein
MGVQAGGACNAEEQERGCRDEHFLRRKLSKKVRIPPCLGKFEEAFRPCAFISIPAPS